MGGGKLARYAGAAGTGGAGGTTTAPYYGGGAGAAGGGIDATGGGARYCGPVGGAEGAPPWFEEAIILYTKEALAMRISTSY
ncbi:hypothetical protein FRC05_005850, partial [Tulasnella sp. 425]